MQIIEALLDKNLFYTQDEYASSFNSGIDVNNSLIIKSDELFSKYENKDLKLNMYDKDFSVSTSLINDLITVNGEYFYLINCIELGNNISIVYQDKEVTLSPSLISRAINLIGFNNSHAAYVREITNIRSLKYLYGSRKFMCVKDNRVLEISVKDIVDYLIDKKVINGIDEEDLKYSLKYFVESNNIFNRFDLDDDIYRQYTSVTSHINVEINKLEENLEEAKKRISEDKIFDILDLILKTYKETNDISIILGILRIKNINYCLLDDKIVFNIGEYDISLDNHDIKCYGNEFEMQKFDERKELINMTLDQEQVKHETFLEAQKNYVENVEVPKRPMVDKLKTFFCYLVKKDLVTDLNEIMKMFRNIFYGEDIELNLVVEPNSKDVKQSIVVKVSKEEEMLYYRVMDGKLNKIDEIEYDNLITYEKNNIINLSSVSTQEEKVSEVSHAR